MQGAQRGVTHEDDTHFEIADFRDTLKQCIEDEDTVYGYKNKPRNQEPSMFQLLSWQDKEDALWDYTKKDKHLIEASVANQLKYKINKSSNHWVTENMDQFRKFAYSPSKKAVFFDLEDPTKGRPSASKDATIPKEVVEHLRKPHPDQQVYVKELPLKASETLDKYTIQDLKNLKDVLKVIESRAISKGGDVIKNPIAHQLTDHYNYQDEFDREERERNGYPEEQDEDRRDEESSEEDVKVDKADYSNVQSRLLTKSIKKAKELDPVYEKERLQRRQDRIKKLNETTRWLPNTAFKTYFGKPPFENYGRGNVKPTVGGSVYGDYMKSHNINPHAGDNKPEFKQIYDRADLAATRYPDAQPEPPRKCKDEIRLSQKQVDDLKRRNPLVPEKFDVKSKTIVKPDLVNSLRFASEENTPENSVDEKNKSSKPKKNLGESLKQLNKKTKAIRKEINKNSPTEVAKKRNKSEPKVKKQEQAYRRTQELLRQDNQKPAASAKKETRENEYQEARKTLTQSESKQQRTQSRTNDAQDIPRERSTSRKTKKVNEYDIAEDFDYSKQTLGAQSQPQQKARGNESQGVRELMNDPPSAFQDRPRTRGKIEAERSPTSIKKEVSFKQASGNKSASKYQEAPVAHQAHKEQHDFGKVEDLQTLLKETQKNDKLWNKVNEDMNGTLNVNPMAPPKNYLFSLAQKETDPRYYKNVPAVWLNRIPYAGKKSEAREDIKGVFGSSQ